MVFQFQLKIFSFEFERKGLFSGSENVFSSFQSGCAQRDVEFLLPDPEKAWVGRRGYHATDRRGSRPSAASLCKMCALGLRQAQR